MIDQDRGAYTPQTDAPLAFDARRTRSSGGGPAPLTLMISGMVLVVLVFAIVLFYRNGVRGGGDSTPQVVGAPIGQAKAPAPADQQPADPAAGLQVYKSEVTPPSEARPAAPKFAPAPEQPAPRPAPQAAPPAPAAVTVASLPPPTPSPQQAAAPVAKPPAKAVRPETLATAAATAAAGDTSTPRPPTASAAAAPVKPAPATAASGKALVQIGAFSSTALADKGWSDVAALMPGAMAGKTKKVESTVKDGTTFYRAYVGGFASASAAQSFCASLKAAGKACFVK